MKVEGQPSPRFRAYEIDINDSANECVFECDELLELKEFERKRRADKRYKWRFGGRWMSSSEFDEWRARQGGGPG